MLGARGFASAENLAFVAASSHRRAVLETLRDWPKTTGQVARACGLSSAHTSRAIRELTDRGLALCLTPALKGRGRLHGLTEVGRGLPDPLSLGPRPLPMTPMVRGTHAYSWFEALSRKLGRSVARAFLADLGLEVVLGSPGRSWIPLRSQMRLLEEIERQFGDGSYATVRRLAAEAVQFFPSVRRYFIRAIPPRLLIELAPAAYLREFNHGRIEVEVSEATARLRNYDWLSSPARCAAWHGSYEGLFTLRKIEASVEKEACILEGEEFCGYVAKWTETHSSW